MAITCLYCSLAWAIACDSWRYSFNWGSNWEFTYLEDEATQGKSASESQIYGVKTLLFSAGYLLKCFSNLCLKSFYQVRKCQNTLMKLNWTSIKRRFDDQTCLQLVQVVLRAHQRVLDAGPGVQRWYNILPPSHHHHFHQNHKLTVIWPVCVHLFKMTSPVSRVNPHRHL